MTVVVSVRLIVRYGRVRRTGLAAKLIVVVDTLQETFRILLFFFSSRRRHTRFDCDWSSDVCSSDLEAYQSALHTALHFPRLFTAAFLGFCIFSVLLVFVLGRDFFPKVDAGQIRLHLRARTGLRIEETARLADQVNSAIRETIPKEEITTLLDNIGVPYSGINLSYSNAGTIGTSDAEILVQLKAERGKSTAGYINDLRQGLPKEFPGVQFFFQPADIVTQILNFGTPAPIDVEITGINQKENYLVGEKLAAQMRHI